MKTQAYNQSKDLKAIAAEISRQYAAGEGRRFIGRIEFAIGAFKIRCVDCPEAVSGIVTRYQKAAGRQLAASGTIATMRAAERGTWPETLAECLADVQHETLPA